MSQIKFSKQFYELLTRVVKVSKPKCTLMFKSDGRARITIPTPSMYTHISAGPADLDFESDTVNIFSLSEFAKYADAIHYPDRGSVELTTELSITGRNYEYIKFNGSSITCRTITADPSCFKKGDWKVPSTQENDKMKLICQMSFDADTVDDFTKKLKLVPTCRFVTFYAKDDARFYIKGKMAQQITYSMDEMHSRFIDEDLAANVFTPDHIVMHDTSYFSIMKGIGGDYIVDERCREADYKCAMKAYSDFPGANPDDPIKLTLINSQAEASGISNYDMVM